MGHVLSIMNTKLLSLSLALALSEFPVSHRIFSFLTFSLEIENRTNEKQKKVENQLLKIRNRGRKIVQFRIITTLNHHMIANLLNLQCL